MKRFKNLLAIVNASPGDQEIVERATELARSNDARLSFCSALNADGPASSLLKKTETFQQLERLLKNERNSALERAVRHAEAQGQPATAHLLEGKPFLTIIRQAIGENHDLVLFPDEPTPSLSSRLFGSTATHLLRKCPCPVWVLKPQAEQTQRARFRRVLAAVNAVADSPEETELNRKILELATSLASREAAEMHVIHCWDVYGESMLAGPRGFLSPDELSLHRSETRDLHEHALNAILEPRFEDGHRIRKHLSKGDPGILIPDVADRIGADVVVMGTVARTGIDGVFIGNTAEQVIQRIGRSVLAVKPDGFVSPVKPKLDGS